MGHCWTIFAGFRGGKGVATAAGMLLVLYPLAIPLCLLVFALVVWLTRYVSVGSLSAVSALPLFLLIANFGFGHLTPPALWILAVVMVCLIFYTHRANIRRLMAGTESRFGREK
jgi:glycerol-3-phosphate acyltransferase PlsY